VERGLEVRGHERGDIEGALLRLMVTRQTERPMEAL
jgi:hypothetical protein